MAIRSTQQNKSIHLYCTMLADALNEAGHDMRAVFEVKKVPVAWTGEGVKECLWKPLQEKLYGKRSTAELETTEVGDVYDALDKALNLTLGVTVNFPTERQES